MVIAPSNLNILTYEKFPRNWKTVCTRMFISAFCWSLIIGPESSSPTYASLFSQPCPSNLDEYLENILPTENRAIQPDFIDRTIHKAKPSPQIASRYIFLHFYVLFYHTLHGPRKPMQNCALLGPWKPLNSWLLPQQFESVEKKIFSIFLKHPRSKSVSTFGSQISNSQKKLYWSHAKLSIFEPSWRLYLVSGYWQLSFGFRLKLFYSQLWISLIILVVRIFDNYSEDSYLMSIFFMEQIKNIWAQRSGSRCGGEYFSSNSPLTTVDKIDFWACIEYLHHICLSVHDSVSKDISGWQICLHKMQN